LKLPPPPKTNDQAVNRWLNLLYAELKDLGKGEPSEAPGVTDHTKLDNLNSSTHTHLTASQAQALTNGGITTLHAHASGPNPGDFTNSAALFALSGLTPAADQVPYFTSATAAALTGLTAYSRSLLDETSAANWRTELDAQQTLGYTPINKAGDTGLGSAFTTAGSFSIKMPTGNYGMTLGSDTGAHLELEGDAVTGTPGGFALVAYKGTPGEVGVLRGLPAGSLAWESPTATERWVLTADGDMGLGTDAPDHFANYVGATISSTSGGFLFLKSTTGTITGQFVADNGLSAVQVGSRTNHDVLLQTNNVTRATLSSTGLDIVGALNVGGALSFGGVAVTASVTEINYVDGVTSAIQTQLDAKAGSASPTFTGTVSAAAITASGAISADSLADSKGDVRTIPQNSKSADYTLVLSDAGKHILHPSADTTGRTFTIPANSSVAFPIGTAVTFVNQASAGTLTLSITTDTMRLAGSGSTGSRTLAANGIATAIKVTSTEWLISGTNLT
jgi:hypothetical protein